RPIYYAGSSTGSGGHAWVLDGYQGDNHFHMNWGWYGYYNGYYYLNNLNPGTDNFNQGQQAVVGIEPAGGIFLTEGFEGTTFPPNGWNRTHTSWARTTTSGNIITGAASAMNSGLGNQNGKRLSTPLLTIDGTIPLTFKGRRGSTGRSEAITVQYSSDGTNWTSLGTYTLTGTTQTFTQSLASLTPGDYYLGFLTANATTNATQMKYYIIDDVSGPSLWVNPNPSAAINISSWNAGSIAPGEASHSGNIFQLSNVAGWTLTINSITSLSGTEFSTSLNPNVALVTGQTHEFGFSYEPLNYGTDNVTFVINTNGGNISISLAGSGAYSLFSDSFESYNDFVLSFPPWTQHDG
ncbi:MAG: choice-of-anchor J domain-containing protein, partial [Candidatus Cloacimonadaceae bacterium]|nr:choice-of-anchor J domain-containing protein [Candidatus Cloacimonadaceae bacterium]